MTSEVWIWLWILSYQFSSGQSWLSFTSSQNSSLFRVMRNSGNVTVFVVVPQVSSQEEERLVVESSSGKRTLNVQSPSEWLLSVQTNQHFFYNLIPKQVLHVLCHLRFNIENSSRFVGARGSCITSVAWPGTNVSLLSSSCDLTIGRSPSVCSTFFDLSGFYLPPRTPTWGSVTAQLFLNGPDSPTLIASSYNSMPIVFNHDKPVNWTVVQEHNNFGLLSIGLPLTSVKAGTNLILPISISDGDDISSLRILVDYDGCLSQNSVKVVDQRLWSLKTSFESSQDKQSGVIKIESLNGKQDSRLSDARPIMVHINFTVVEKPGPGPCTIKVGVSRVDSLSGASMKIFSRDSFQEHQSPININIDPEMMDIICFKQSQMKTVVLLQSHSISGAPPRGRLVPLEVSTYLLQQSGDHHYLPQLLSTTNIMLCSSFGGTLPCPGIYQPQSRDDHWILPVSIEHWRTVLYDINNEWRPHSWTLDISDLELNPVSVWRVPYKSERGEPRCMTMYQSARLTVGVKLVSINSMGLKSFLGATLDNPEPWLDVSSSMMRSLKVTSEPPDAVIFSQGPSGTYLVHVNRTGSALIRVHGVGPRGLVVLASRKMSVFTSHWASVSGVSGRCISALGPTIKDAHPRGESQYLVVEVAPVPGVGGRCQLFLEVRFNDGTWMALEDLDPASYRLEVNGARIPGEKSPWILYQRSVSVSLSESVFCKDWKLIFSGNVDLGGSRGVVVSDGDLQDQSIVVNVTSPGPRSSREGSQLLPRNVVLGAVYLVTGLVLMAVLLLLVNCLVGASVRRQPLFHLRRRLSKSRTLDGGGLLVSKNRLPKTSLSQDQYPSLLPPPGPIIVTTKQQSEWATSSESGLGVDHCSSQGSHLLLQGEPPHLPILATFRCSQPGGSAPFSDSSSSSTTFVRQTSPLSDPILVDSISNSSSLLLMDPHGCYWALANSNLVQGPPSYDKKSSSARDPSSS